MLERPLSRPQLWFERMMAIAATLNFGLVLFDLSYVSWRDFWLQGRIAIPLIQRSVFLPVPQIDCPDRSVPSNQPPRTYRTSPITCLYDPIKGIEPNRETQQYLLTVQKLADQLQQQDLSAPQVQNTLADLRQLSREMVDQDPFRRANKSGTLEKIKNRMRNHIFGQRSASSKQAFERFWSSAYLTPTTWRSELVWFNREIVPLMETNYFRSIDESGDLTNNFGWLDTPFALVFLLEFLVRTHWLSRHQRGLDWTGAMLWRWYDVLLFFPFWLWLPGWAWLRIIPVGVRLDQARLINLERLRRQLSQGLIASVAEELTTAVVLRVLSQLQGAIRQGNFNWLGSSSNPQIYANSIDELTEISTLLVKLTVYRVLPQVQPDVEALLTHSLASVLHRSPAYQSLKLLPGVGELPDQLLERLVNEIVQAAYQSLTTSMEDPVGTELSRRLVQHFVQSWGTEVQQQAVLGELKFLLNEWLEELKQAYGDQHSPLEPAKTAIVVPPPPPHQT